MSTKSRNSVLDSALNAIDRNFRDKIVTTYLEIKQNWLEGRHEATGIAGGKLCEIVLRLLQQRVHGNHTPFGEQIPNFADECRRLVTAAATAGSESERIVIPRALVFAYTIRNKRGIGHVGGDVDANQIDALAIVTVSDWILCELIRIHHGLSLEEAQDLIDGLSIRQVPTIWEVGGKKRVLRDGVGYKDKTLLLLYSSKESWVLVEDLFDWVEYSNLNMFKQRILVDLHDEKLVEYDRDNQSVILSPKGAHFVEKGLLNPKNEMIS